VIRGERSFTSAPAAAEFECQAKRAAVATMIEHCDLSERRACRLVGLSRDSYRINRKVLTPAAPITGKQVVLCRCCSLRGSAKKVFASVLVVLRKMSFEVCIARGLEI